jgi:hypothetical protein
MLGVWDSLFCQLFHGSFAEVVSYSRQGAWRCKKPNCRAQRIHDACLAAAAALCQKTEVARAQTAAPAASSASPERERRREVPTGMAAD